MQVRSPELLPHAPALAVCTPQSTLGDVLRQLCSAHRLFLVDAEQRAQGVVSISDVLRRCVAGGGGE